ncbi:hypothetical protein, partial [Prevotellamassilia timonensis]|uniref:hypothetical protein n=1 Tax=Prevotellamassilia timonensis TaxID=1852370 RepID=UPI003FD85632
RLRRLTAANLERRVSRRGVFSSRVARSSENFSAASGHVAHPLALAFLAARFSPPKKLSRF